MTAATARPEPASRVTLARVVRGEWIKLRGQRSTWWVLALSVVIPLLAIVIFAVNAAPASPERFSETDAVLGSVTSSIFETLVLFVLLGAFIGTNEYETRTITTTMAAVPRRWPVVIAKVVVTATVTAVVSLVVLLIGLLIASAIVPTSTPVGLTDEGMLPALLGTALFEVCTAVIGLGAALLLRSSIGAVAVTFGFLYVVPAAINEIPLAAAKLFSLTFPGPASDRLTALADTPDHLPYPVAAVALLLWTAVWVLVSVLVVRRRDV